MIRLRRSLTAGAILLLLFVVRVTASAPSVLSDSELHSLFTEGNQLFRQANEISRQDPIAAEDLYRRAALRFERIVAEGGIRNGKLFYNIGNAYFRTNDIGRALLNYRRAEQYIPGDPNLLQNLAHARSTRSDHFEEEQQTQVLKTVLFWHYDLSTRVRSILFVALSFLFWCGAALKLFRSEWVPTAAWVGVGGVAALVLGSLVVEAWVNAEEPPGVMLAEQVIARKGDGESYEPSFKEPLHAGTEFFLVENRGEWRHIELPDGRRCWVPAQSSQLVNP